MKKHFPSLPVACTLGAGLMVSNRTAVQAQVAATVSLNSSSSTGTIPVAAFGVNAPCL